MILVADDNEILRELHLRQLAQLGFTAESAANGREVLECVSRRRYDLILMDISMPELDGFEAARLIRMVERLTNSPHTPVVAVTGVSNVVECMDEGLDDFVAKPVMLDQLKTVVNRWISPAGTTSDKANAIMAAAGTVIRARREALGLSQQEVATKAGIPIGLVTHLETGASDLDLSLLGHLSRVLEMHVVDLVAWIELVAREGEILGK